MQNRKYSIAISISLTICSTIVAFSWLIQAHVYAAQGMSFTSMLQSEFSAENPERISSYWAACYPILMFSLALIYWFSRLSTSKQGLFFLATATTILAASAFHFTLLPIAAILSLPCALAWLSFAVFKVQASCG